MIIFLAVVLILVITGFVWFLGRTLSLKICPICAGVSGAWLLFTVAMLAGADETLLLPPTLLLMGGSVVGIAYQGERSFRWATRHPLLWKMIVISIGIPLAFLAANSISIETFSVEIVILGVLSYFFFVRTSISPIPEKGVVSHSVKKLEQEMKNCC